MQGCISDIKCEPIPVTALAVFDFLLQNCTLQLSNASHWTPGYPIHQPYLSILITVNSPRFVEDGDLQNFAFLKFLRNIPVDFGVGHAVGSHIQNSVHPQNTVHLEETDTFYKNVPKNIKYKIIMLQWDVAKTVWLTQSKTG